MTPCGLPTDRTSGWKEPPRTTTGTLHRTSRTDCREAYRNSLHRLMKEKVDVFIGNHTWNNDTFNKAKVLMETGENQFIDDKLWNRFLEFCESRLDKVIAEDGE